jgi:hypothetical protein
MGHGKGSYFLLLFFILFAQQLVLRVQAKKRMLWRGARGEGYPPSPQRETHGVEDPLLKFPLRFLASPLMACVHALGCPRDRFDEAPAVVTLPRARLLEVRARV